MTVSVIEARGFLDRRARADRERRRALAVEAEADAGRIVRMLIDDYAPSRIYRWGSLLQPECFREWSDIDVAVEGLHDPLAGLHALDDACKLTHFPVDLVELERIHPLHAETIRKSGVLVHERS